MDPILIAAFMSFLALVVAWVALPTSVPVEHHSALSPQPSAIASEGAASS